MLHLVQSAEGHVTSRGIEACAEILGISAAEVSGVATFYTMYKRRPVGDYHVGVCTNTLCAVMGGDLIFERLKDHLDIGNDETTDDGKITLEHIECNAACDYAPVMTVNWEFFDNMTPQKATDLVDDLRAGEPVQLHPRPAPGHLARGRAGPRGLPRRPRRRGPRGRSGLAGRAGHRARPRLDRAERAGGRGVARARPRQPRERRGRHHRRQGRRAATEAEETESDAAVEESPGRHPAPRQPRQPRRRQLMTDMLTPVLTANWDADRAWTLASYEDRGGYDALRTALAMEPADVVEAVKASDLRGRGGAGFPTGMKWGFIPQDNPNPKYLVVNADESEPGTCKDVPLMMASPHTLVEGVIISSYAIRAHTAFIYVRGEVLHVVRRLQPRGRGGLRRRPPRQGHPRLGLRPRPDRARRRRRLHLRRGDGAARLARGPSRPTAPAAAVPGGRRASTPARR